MICVHGRVHGRSFIIKFGLSHSSPVVVSLATQLGIPLNLLIDLLVRTHPKRLHVGRLDRGVVISLVWWHAGVVRCNSRHAPTSVRASSRWAHPRALSLV